NTGSKFIKTIIIRDPRGDYKPSNKHYITHESQRYNIKYVKSDYQDKSYLRVYGEVVI
ncbi:head-tail adaptor protein, partial [Staphylococcus aureus]|nr:head-tail adaptor protein [Staphylococcus aureus]